MKINEFCQQLKDLMEIEDVEITEETRLIDLPEYDSIAVMSIIAMVDEEFGVNLDGEQLSTVQNVNDLIGIIGKDKIGL